MEWLINGVIILWGLMIFFLVFGIYNRLGTIDFNLTQQITWQRSFESESGGIKVKVDS